MNNLKDQVDFSRIRYANCWEDAGLLLDALRIKAGDRMLIVASAGDNALASLTAGPEYVRAVDLSLPQLYLCELKQLAFAFLEYDELLVLLGVGGDRPARRWNLYCKLRPHLGNAAREFWDARRPLIESGVVHGGKFELYFALFRRWLLPLVHNRAAIRQLLEPKSDAEQATYFHRHWNTWRWKALMNIFFSRTIMGRYGRDPQFLKHVSLNVPQFIRAKSEAHLMLGAATRNPFLTYMLTGAFGAHLPAYLQPQAFSLIKQHIGRLQLAEADMDTEVMRATYQLYCGSNIFEYMSANAFHRLAQRWSVAIPQGARLACWNLMAPRSFSEALPGLWEARAASLKEDMGFFYSRFLLEERL